MTRRISSTHLFFLTLVVAASLFLIWSSAGASPTTCNLIVVVPAGVIVILLTLWILIGERRLWAPPLFAAACTFLMVKFFGSLFPFPMPLLVL